MFSALPKTAALLSRTGRALLDLLYPPHCAICGAGTESGRVLCLRCAGKTPRLEAPFCEVCSTPFPGKIEGPFVCWRCQELPFAFKCAVSSRRSTESVRELIHQFKYGGRLPLKTQLADWLAETLADPRLQAPPCERLVPVPLHPTRQRERGFNQSRVLAEELCRRSGIPVCDCLRRTRYTQTQTALEREERMENLRGAFRMRHNRGVTGLHLLLIDDVLTTGSTVDECARVLMAAGAASVRVATVARA